MLSSRLLLNLREAALRATSQVHLPTLSEPPIGIILSHTTPDLANCSQRTTVFSIDDGMWVDGEAALSSRCNPHVCASEFEADARDTRLSLVR